MPEERSEPSHCPICREAWDDHNLVRARRCLSQLEEALRLAERVRIRESGGDPPRVLSAKKRAGTRG